MALFSHPRYPSLRPDVLARRETLDTGRRRLMSIGCACCLTTFLPLDARAAASPEVARHLAAAKEAAGTDLLSYMTLGDPATPGYTPPKVSIADLMAMPAPPPGRAFDNLYFVGSKWVSAWAIATSEGIVLIDAMDNEDEAERIAEAGLLKLGLDPSHVRTVIVTHGHGDHYGGANFFKRRSAARIAMSPADWQMLETKLEFDIPIWGRPPERDMSVADGDTVSLGDTGIAVVATPGHTMGTLSLIFPVREGSRTHLALLWGGTAFNFGRKPDRLRKYIESVERTRDIVQKREIDVFLSNHAMYDRAVDKLASMEAGKPNPFVLGTPNVARALTVMSECARAVLASWEVQQ